MVGQNIVATMFYSARNLTRLAKATTSLRKCIHTSVPKNGASFVYRSPPIHPTRNQLLIAEGTSAFVWFWIFYRCLNDWQVFTNEWPSPDPSKWTDEELGIPAIDEDD